MLKERLDAGSCPSSCVADQQTAGYMHLIAHPQRWELHWLRRHAPHAVLVSDPLLAHACHVVPPSHPAHKIAILNFSFPGDCPAKTSENKEGGKKGGQGLSNRSGKMIRIFRIVSCFWVFFIDDTNDIIPSSHILIHAAPCAYGRICVRGRTDACIVWTADYQLCCVICMFAASLTRVELGRD